MEKEKEKGFKYLMSEMAEIGNNTQDYITATPKLQNILVMSKSDNFVTFNKMLAISLNILMDWYFPSICDTFNLL